MEIVKQCAGIDCAKADFSVTFSVCNHEREIQNLSYRTFKNDEQGFKLFNKWMGKLQKKSIPLLLVMEPTGVYHEKLAYFLKTLQYDLALVVPKRAKDFSKTLKVKKVTDKVASQYLAVMGLEKKLDVWTAPKVGYSKLKHLTREREQIQKFLVMLKNELEAESSRYMPSKESISRIKQHIKLLNKQCLDIMSEIKDLLKQNSEINNEVGKMTSIPGVGMLTAVTIIGETNGFELVRNKRQLVSYAGYDVINHESGSSIKTKARISKRGNRHIRKAMHMPALTAIRHSESSKDLFARLVRKTGIKMKGVVAVQRKLLVIMYTLWKNDTVYDPEYELKKEGSITPPHELDLVRS